MAKTKSKSKFIFFLCIVLGFVLTSGYLFYFRQRATINLLSSSPVITGSLTPRITEDGTLTGWSKNTTSPDSQVEIEVYLDGNLAEGQLATKSLANKALFNSQNGFELTLPSLLDGKPHLVYVYGIDKSTGAKINIPGSPLTFPNAPSSAYYNAPNYPESSGWAADQTNYFNTWKCASTTGINTINRLDIASLGKHHESFWKDSLFVNNTEMSGGAPVVYFTAGLNSYIPKFALKKATYNASSNKWQVSDVLSHPRPQKGGFSSQDGLSVNDFVMNEYNIPGWGPTANRKGSQSSIPGVSDTPTAVDVSSYPLTGEGPLGITSITNLKQNDSVGFDTCIHMNPTLYDFEGEAPHSMAVYLGTDTSLATACQLPNGTKLPRAGYYLYHYRDNLGWQLDLGAGAISPDTSISVINYAYGTNRQFLQADYFGKVNWLDLNQPLSTRVNTALDCKSTVYFAEASGTKKAIFFIASTSPSTPDNLTLLDVYYAWDNPALK